jgi:hypothetical protein
MKRLIFLLWFFTAFSIVAFSQDNLADYKRAQTIIGYGNYVDAMKLLRPYMDEGAFGELALYAQYHFAYSAYQNGQYELGKSVLGPLVERKNWKQADEARYLLALHFFQDKENLKALQEIEAITDPEIYKQAENATFEFLNESSVSFLVANFSKFQKNNGFMQVMKRQLEKQTVMSADERAALSQIRNQGKSTTATSSVSRNSVLDVAVILPFNYSGGSGVHNLNASNFVFELFQGLNFATEEIRSKGTQLNIRTFDSERSADKLKKILTDPFFAQADVIIGPIYPEESELVASFSQKNGIPFINPLSNIDDKFDGQDHAFLFRPSVSSIADGIIDFARKNGVGKRLAIAYSNTSRDEALSKRLAQVASQFGFEVVVNRQVNDKNVRGFLEGINISRFGQPTVDMVVMLSDDPNVASPTFALMESLNKELPVLVMDTWLYFNFANYEMLETQNFHFISNNSVRFDKVENFREAFNTRFNIYPSYNAHLGYELMLWLADNLNASKGFDLRKNLNQRAFQEGKVTYGFDFRGANFNKFVPILKLERGVLEPK